METGSFYFRPKKEISTEYKIKKSVFIGHTFAAIKQDLARKKILEVSLKHKQATHNCWAFKCEYPDSIEASSDDGEPAGTAGVPILGVIKKNNLDNTLIMVTRYFGGIQLGIRGLIEAYRTAAEMVLEEAGISKTFPVKNLKVRTDYQNLTRVNHLFKSVTLDGVTPGQKFEAKITITYPVLLNMLDEAENLAKTLLNTNKIFDYSWES